jgi:hypothetical protein
MESPPVAGYAYSPKQQAVVLYATSYAGRDVSVPGSKICRVTLSYRPSQLIENQWILANSKFPYRYAWDPKSGEVPKSQD